MFAKIFAQIFDSSLVEDYQVRLVFEDFLILADRDGVVDMTPESISRRTNVPIEIVLRGILELEAPDPKSRTPAEQGRRLVRLDDHRAWGWRVVNYVKYRESATKEMLRMAEADRKKAYRQRFTRNVRDKSGTKQDMSARVPDCSASLSQSSSSGSVLEGDARGNQFPEVEVPGWDTVKLAAEKLGLPEWRAKDWFNEMEQCGWKDRQGREVMNWKAYLSRVKTWWERDGRQVNPPSTTNGVAKPKSIYELSMILKVKESEAANIKLHNCRQVATGPIWTNAKEHEKYRAVMKEVKTLRAEIGSR